MQMTKKFSATVTSVVLTRLDDTDQWLIKYAADGIRLQQRLSGKPALDQWTEDLAAILISDLGAVYSHEEEHVNWTTVALWLDKVVP